MADAAANGVTDPNGKVWGTRGSTSSTARPFRAPLGMNPSATIAAVAERNVRKALADPTSPVFTPTPLPMDQGRSKLAGEHEAHRDPEQLGQTDAILDPAKGTLAATQSPTAARTIAVGLTFKEVMQGFYARDPFVNLPIRSDFLATIDDLNASRQSSPPCRYQRHGDAQAVAGGGTDRSTARPARSALLKRAETVVGRRGAVQGMAERAAKASSGVAPGRRGHGLAAAAARAAGLPIRNGLRPHLLAGLGGRFTSTA